MFFVQRESWAVFQAMKAATSLMEGIQGRYPGEQPFGDREVKEDGSGSENEGDQEPEKPIANRHMWYFGCVPIGGCDWERLGVPSRAPVQTTRHPPNLSSKCEDAR